VRGLELLRELAGERVRRGIVLYSGRQCVPLGKDLHALPIESLWRIRAQNTRTWPLSVSMLRASETPTVKI
jgi:hypothetical protein